jgi:DHA1 family tetracycline resistance protein-like MFS transporter
MVGLSFMLMGLATAVVQGVLIRKVVPRIGEQRALFIGLIASITGYTLLGFADRSWTTLVLTIVLALGRLADPALQAIVSREVSAAEQGALQGSMNSLMGVAAIVGPLIGTNLLAMFGPETAQIHVPGAAFFASAAMSALGLLLAARLFRASNEESPTRKELIDGRNWK